MSDSSFFRVFLRDFPFLSIFLLAIMLVVVSYFLARIAIQKLRGVIRGICLILLALCGSWLGTAFACWKGGVKWAFWFSVACGIFSVFFGKLV